MTKAELLSLIQSALHTVVRDEQGSTGQVGEVRITNIFEDDDLGLIVSVRNIGEHEGEDDADESWDQSFTIDVTDITEQA